MRQLKTQCFAGMTAVLLLFAATAAAAQVTLVPVREEAGDNHVEYIRLEGLDNAPVQDSVNAALASAAHEHLNTLAVLRAGNEGSLKVDTQATLYPSGNGHDVLSVLMTVEGRLPNGRSGFVRESANYDLANGQLIGPDDLFLDPALAARQIEDAVYSLFENDLSTYLELDTIRPFPLDRLLLTESGLAFYYPQGGLVWLSGRSASIHLLYHEMDGLLNLSDGSILSGLGVPALLEAGPESKEKIEDAVKAGRLPGLDATLGGSLNELIATHKLLYDPEGFPEGDRYQLEDDAYRGTSLISRDGVLVDGVLSTRMNLFGLMTGKTGRADAVALLGEPVFSLDMGQAAAELYGLPEGTMDTYRIDGYELRLYYQEKGTLYAVWLQRPPINQ